MSQTFHLECTDCKEELWVGQSCNSESGGLKVYTADPHIPKLQRFLLKHQGHALRFVEINELDLDSTEFEPEDIE